MLTVPGRFRLVPVAADGQEARAMYQRDPDGAYRFHGVQVAAITATGIARIVAFLGPDLCVPFRLPREAEPGPTITDGSAGL